MAADLTYVFIARALQCDPATLSIGSALNKHPNWDSFGHLQLLLALERDFGVEINDEAIEELSSFSAIEQLISKRSENS